MAPNVVQRIIRVEIVLAPFSSPCPKLDFWMHFGHPLAHFGIALGPFSLPSTPFWLTVAALWLTFGTRGLTFGQPCTRFSQSWSLLASFLTFVYISEENIMQYPVSLKMSVESQIDDAFVSERVF